MSIDRGGATIRGEAAKRYSEWLASKMDERRWNQAELARRSHLKKATVSSMLKGEATQPTAWQVSQIARALRTDPNEVYRALGLWPGDGPRSTPVPFEITDALQHTRRATEQLERYLGQEREEAREIVPEPGDRLAALDREPPEPRGGDDWNPA